MRNFTRQRFLLLAALCSCLAVAPARAQKPRGNEAQAGDGRLFPVMVNMKWGYVDRTGKFVIEPKYDIAGEFSDGLAIVRYGLITEGLDKIEPVGNTVFIPVGPEGIKWEAIDASGKTVIKLAPDIDFFASGFTEGLSPFSVWVSGKGSVHGYMDKAGKTVIEPQFRTAGFFREGLAAVCTEFRKCGFIDRSGKFVVRPKYHEILPFSDDLAVVATDEDLAGFVNKKGEMVIAPQFSMRFEIGFSEGLSAVAFTGSNKHGYINKLGHLAIPPEFDYAGIFSEGLAAVSTNGKYGYINHEGKFVIPPQFAYAGAFGEGVAAASTCASAPSPTLMSDSESSTCGFGYIDKSSKFVIEQRFNMAGPFRNGVAQVITNEGGRAYIDRTGNYIWKQSR